MCVCRCKCVCVGVNVCMCVGVNVYMCRRMCVREYIIVKSFILSCLFL